MTMSGEGNTTPSQNKLIKFSGDYKRRKNNMLASIVRRKEYKHGNQRKKK